MLTYRTSGAWGAGKGANLTAAEIDENFHGLDTRLQDVENNPLQPAVIETIESSGSAITVTLTDGSVFGPLPLPAAVLVSRGNWAPSTAYHKNDIVTVGTAVYFVAVSHTSGTSFDPTLLVSGSPAFNLMLDVSSAIGPDAVGLLVAGPHTGISFAYDPDAGTLSATVSAPSVTIGAAVSGKPDNGQKVIIPVTQALHIAAGATGSVATALTAATASTDIVVQKNGTAIGTVRFAAGGTAATFVSFAETAFAAGDSLVFVFPATADATLADAGIALKFDVVP